MDRTHTEAPSCKTSVIIPYYQEQPGILREAVLSAIAQEGVMDLEIIVVDDGSPAPARDDLVDVNLPPHVALKLIEQSNRGPGAARNRALHSVSPDAVYVAFLDSDDRWNNTHLLNGQLALELGCDIYFADYWLSERKTRFFVQGTHVSLDQTDYGADPQLRQLEEHTKPELIQGSFRLHISTMIYRYQILENTRFPESFWIGEDLAFFLAALEITDKIGFSSMIEAFSLPGVNIYKKAGWDTPKAIWALLEEAKSRQWISDNIGMTREERLANMRRSHEIGLDFVRNMIHELRSGRGFRNRDIIRFLALNPKALQYIFPVAAGQIYQKIRKPSRASSATPSSNRSP